MSEPHVRSTASEASQGRLPSAMRPPAGRATTPGVSSIVAVEGRHQAVPASDSLQRAASSSGEPVPNT